jgi:hypothetical protein
LIIDQSRHRLIPIPDGFADSNAVVPWAGPLHEAKKSLEAFDDSWWLDNSGKASEALFLITSWPGGRI